MATTDKVSIFINGKKLGEVSEPDETPVYDKTVISATYKGKKKNKHRFETETDVIILSLDEAVELKTGETYQININYIVNHAKPT